jgi:hypothetical protein
MLIIMLRMNDDDGPDIEHVVICHHADNRDCFAKAECLILSRPLQSPQVRGFVIFKYERLGEYNAKT